MKRKSHGCPGWVAALLVLTGCLGIGAGFPVLGVTGSKSGLKRGIILESVATGPARIIGGASELAACRACPASVFKLVITWAGLETGVLTPGTRIPCREDRIAPGICKLGLRDALLRSSNRYFESVAGDIGREKMTEFASRSGIVDGPVPEAWLKRGTNAAVWGGDLLVTPSRVHAMMVRIANGTFASPGTNETLVSAIEWPCERKGMRIFGKSGTMRGAVWFTGFAREPAGRIRTVTVFLRGGLSRKPEAASLFFSRFGIEPPVLPPPEGIDKRVPSGGK